MTHADDRLQIPLVPDPFHLSQPPLPITIPEFDALKLEAQSIQGNTEESNNRFLCPPTSGTPLRWRLPRNASLLGHRTRPDD